MLIFSHLLLIAEQQASSPFFMAKEEQMLQQDVKSSPKCSVCTESSTFSGCGINFVLCQARVTPLLPFGPSRALAVPPRSSSSAGTGRRGKDTPTHGFCGQEYFAGMQRDATHTGIFSCPMISKRSSSTTKKREVLWWLSATHPSKHK